MEYRKTVLRVLGFGLLALALGGCGQGSVCLPRDIDREFRILFNPAELSLDPYCFRCHSSYETGSNGFGVDTYSDVVASGYAFPVLRREVLYVLFYKKVSCRREAGSRLMKSAAFANGLS